MCHRHAKGKKVIKHKFNNIKFYSQNVYAGEFCDIYIFTNKMKTFGASSMPVT